MLSNDWTSAVQTAWTVVIDQLPAVGGAALVLLVGWVVAKICAFVARTGTERALRKLGSSDAMARALDTSGATSVAPRLIAGSLFWIVMVLFTVAAVEILGLPILTELFGRLAAYLPNIVAAIALIVGGLVVARLLRGPAVRAAAWLRLEHHADRLSAIVHTLTVAVATVMALEQLGVEGRVLEIILAITLGSIFAAGALAFALGARPAVSNIVAARYVSQLCRVGDTVSIDGHRGTVVQITATAVILQSDEGQTAVPAGRFHEGCPLIVQG